MDLGYHYHSNLVTKIFKQKHKISGSLHVFVYVYEYVL